MQETGEVVSVTNNTLKVRIYRKSACGDGCASCGLCKNNENIIEVKNSVNAQIGDKVTLEISSGKLFKAAFLVYIIPLIMLIAGYYIGRIFTKNEGLCVLSAFLLMIISLIAISIYDRRLKGKFTPQVISIIE